MSDSEGSAVTYTSVYTDSEPRRVFWGADEELSDGGSPLVIVYGYDGLPMQPIAPPSPDYVPGPEHPPSPDYVPGPEHPPSPIYVPYVPKLEYPEYLEPSDDEDMFPAKEQPLPLADSPTAILPGIIAESDPEEYEADESEDGPVDYPIDGGDDDDGNSFGDDADDGDEDDGDEEDGGRVRRWRKEFIEVDCMYVGFDRALKEGQRLDVGVSDVMESGLKEDGRGSARSGCVCTKELKEIVIMRSFNISRRVEGGRELKEGRIALTKLRRRSRKDNQQGGIEVRTTIFCSKLQSEDGRGEKVKENSGGIRRGKKRAGLENKELKTRNEEERKRNSWGVAYEKRDNIHKCNGKECFWEGESIGILVKVWKELWMGVLCRGDSKAVDSLCKTGRGGVSSLNGKGASKRRGLEILRYSWLYFMYICAKVKEEKAMEGIAPKIGLVDEEEDEEEEEEEEEEEKEEEEEEEEEHIAPTNSVVISSTIEPVPPPKGAEPVIPPPSTHTTTIGARITVWLQASISLPLTVEVERLLAMPTPPPSQLDSLSPPSAEDRLARFMASSAHSSPPPVSALVDAITVALPSPLLPPLPPSLYIPPPVDHRDDIPESKLPHRKRLCLSTLGSREVGYGIRETWIDPVKAVPEIAPMTLGEVDTRVTELAKLHEHDTQDLYALLEDAQDGKTRISQRVDLLMEDRIAVQETVLTVEEEAYAS
ncbi:hypothetical protein Tco_1555223 [Tanacetum coccineum]